MERRLCHGVASGKFLLKLAYCQLFLDWKRWKQHGDDDDDDDIDDIDAR